MLNWIVNYLRDKDLHWFFYWYRWHKRNARVEIVRLKASPFEIVRAATVIKLNEMGILVECSFMESQISDAKGWVYTLKSIPRGFRITDMNINAFLEKYGVRPSDQF